LSRFSGASAVSGNLKTKNSTLIQIGKSHDRQIFYTNIWADKNWIDNFPTDNWLVFIIGQDKDIEAYRKLADKAITNNVLYLCATGECCKLIHDTFDETIFAQKIKNAESIDSPDDFENSPMTTWHSNFSEGFWFSISSAHHGTKTIDKIVCVDFTKRGVKRHLTNLIEKINKSWLPSDEENEEPIYDN
jgi:hypothetical protein